MLILRIKVNLDQVQFFFVQSMVEAMILSTVTDQPSEVTAKCYLHMRSKTFNINAVLLPRPLSIMNS